MTYLSKNINSFSEDGFIDFGPILDKDKCSKLLEQVHDTREWSQNLFRSQEACLSDPQMKKTNPGKGICNLAENYDLDFIEKHPVFTQHLERILGNNYRILLQKFVVGVPNDWVPDWLKAVIEHQLVSNLGPYIKKQFRDVTYFRGIDYHMDLIDHPGTVGDYVTVYVYLDDVNENMSPLHLVEKSHIFGATKFPHVILNDKLGSIEYGEDQESVRKFRKNILTGECGSVYLWSSMTLHGTKPHESNLPRISLRYTIQKDPHQANTLVDQLIDPVRNRKAPSLMRDDIDLNSKNHQQLKFNKTLKK